MIKSILSAVGILLAPVIFIFAVPAANFGVFQLLSGSLLVGLLVTFISGVVLIGCIAVVIGGILVIVRENV